jgi:hypothetical protein
VNQGPRGDCLMKKTEGRKSRDTAPLRNKEFVFQIRGKNNSASVQIHNIIKRRESMQKMYTMLLISR